VEREEQGAEMGKICFIDIMHCMLSYQFVSRVDVDNRNLMRQPGSTASTQHICDDELFITSSGLKIHE